MEWILAIGTRHHGGFTISDYGTATTVSPGALARRAATLLAGALLLAASFAFGYDDARFYVFSGLLGLCWTFGWFADRALVPREDRRLVGLALGAAAGCVLAAGCGVGVIVLRDVPVIGESIAGVFGPIEPGLFAPVLVTAILVGVGEELFFRGGVYGWFRARPVVGSTVVYLAVTLATASLSLLVAAAVLGATTAVLRRLRGGVVAPVACHVTWSVLLLSVLPEVVAK